MGLLVVELRRGWGTEFRVQRAKDRLPAGPRGSVPVQQTTQTVTERRQMVT